MQIFWCNPSLALNKRIGSLLVRVGMLTGATLGASLFDASISLAHPHEEQQYSCRLSCREPVVDEAKPRITGVEMEPAPELAVAGRTFRQRPGGKKRPLSYSPFVYESIPDINSSASEFVTTPDRWKQFYKGKWYDPYNQNILKGDVPIFGSPGHEWFFEAEIVSDTIFERNKIALPVGMQSTSTPGRLNTIGNGLLTVAVQNVATKFALIRGNTTFKPPEYEIRITPVFNFNYVEAEELGALRLDPSNGKTRADGHIGFLELFADVHLADISDRYDFISGRLGIQSFQSDFRGFVYADDQPGLRFFGNWDNNRWQGNLAWFHRLNKDTNSSINTNFDQRYEDVFIANVYRQDLLALGHQVSGSLIYRADRAGDHGNHFDTNGFLRRPAPFGDERPKNVYNWYAGLTGDGHFGRVNTTSAFYYTWGKETNNQIASRSTNISAFLAAQEFSYDIDFVRLRSSFMWASGDSDPFDGKASGFDAIFDLPNFAGGEFSYFQRQGIPLIAGGEVFLTNRLSLLPNLRANKEEGQSNFVNPGLRLVNLGMDVEVTPKTKLITNASYLEFDKLGSLRTLRQDQTFGRSIGFDLSAGLLYRPWLNNNVELIGGAAMLIPGSGIKTLYGDTTLYHFFTTLVLEY